MLDRMFFGRQSKSIETHGVQNCFTNHPSMSGYNVGCCVAFGVTNMQPFSTRIGEHIQSVQFLAGDVCWSPEGFVFIPKSLPTGFDLGWIVLRHDVSFDASRFGEFQRRVAVDKFVSFKVDMLTKWKRLRMASLEIKFQVEEPESGPLSVEEASQSSTSGTGHSSVRLVGDVK